MGAKKMLTECDCCGNCCKNGGAALHTEDLKLACSGKIPLSHLVTVRKGELSIMPSNTDIGDVKKIAGGEFIKLAGTAKSWCCRYYTEKKGKGHCSIYDFRPLACRTLQCWNTSEIETLIGKDLLQRHDILHPSHPLLRAVEQHEKKFPCACVCDVHAVSVSSTTRLTSTQKNEIERLVQGDLNFRRDIVQLHNISVGEELFFFGRPLFQVLAPLGIKTIGHPNGKEIRMDWGQYC